MKIRKHLKSGLKMIIESDANITTLIIRAVKKQLLDFIDRVIPDEEEEKTIL